MSVLEIVQPSGIAPVEGRRTSVERLQDILDPLWRRVLWGATLGSVRQAHRRRPYRTGVVRLSERECALAREVLGRRLSQ
jgi:hypothetical protein